MDSPAMAAGIQSGDVITGMGEMKISNYQELINCILESTPEQSIEVTVLRQGPEGYTEIVLDAVMAIR
jgi:serine protease Do